MIFLLLQKSMVINTDIFQMYFKIKIFPTTPIPLPIQRIGGKLSSHHAWFFRTRIMLTKNRPRPPQASGFLFLVHRRKFPIALNILDFSREEKSSLQKKYEECGTRPPFWCRNTCIARCPEFLEDPQF